MTVALARADMAANKASTSEVGDPHAASGGDYHAGARARQARRCGLMLQSLPDDHILQCFFRCWHV
jgi:hypothetical protein